MGNIALRHKYILDMLKKEGYVRVQDLSAALNVSEVTIRKDLKILENKKLLFKNHGSASSTHFGSVIADKHIDEKEKIHRDEKTRIAKAAVKLLEPNDKIIIASGTTLLAFANEIQVNEPITIISSSIKLSLALCYNPNIDVIQLGGTMRKNSVSVVGHEAENTLSQFTCNKLFLGVDGIGVDSGLTTSDVNEARINQAMIDAAKEVIILTDSSKFSKLGFCKICEVSKVDHIITDTDAPSNIVHILRDQGIKVTLV